MGRGLVCLPLTLTRRCPKSHVEIARKIVPTFEAANDAPNGSVKTVALPEALENISAGDLVLCRNNAPLASICWKLLKRGLKVSIAGRDIGDGLIALIKRMKAGDDVPTLIERIEKYRSKELEKADKRRDVEAATAEINDKCDAIVFLTEGTNSVDDLIKLITKIFADVDDMGEVQESVLLTSIHRAKGLESSVVWFLDPSLCPAKYATQTWEIEQEHNLLYVAQTRSKDKLIYITVDKS